MTESVNMQGVAMTRNKALIIDSNATIKEAASERGCNDQFVRIRQSVNHKSIHNALTIVYAERLTSLM